MSYTERPRKSIPKTQSKPSGMNNDRTPAVSNSRPTKPKPERASNIHRPAFASPPPPDQYVPPDLEPNLPKPRRNVAPPPPPASRKSNTTRPRGANHAVPNTKPRIPPHQRQGPVSSKAHFAHPTKSAHNRSLNSVAYSEPIPGPPEPRRAPKQHPLDPDRELPPAPVKPMAPPDLQLQNLVHNSKQIPEEPSVGVTIVVFIEGKRHERRFDPSNIGMVVYFWVSGLTILLPNKLYHDSYRLLVPGGGVLDDVLSLSMQNIIGRVILQIEVL